MKNFYIILGSLSSAVLVFILALTIYSHARHHRSLMAHLAEKYLKLTVKRYTDDEVREDISNLPSRNDVKYKIPKIIRFSVPVTESEFGGMQVFKVGKEGGDKVILYLHGGGYVRQPRQHHWKFINKLAKRSGLRVIVPIYPKAPNHSYKDAYAILTDLYSEIVKSYKKIVVMGDSSGGGLVLGLCQSFGHGGLRQPDVLILMSPWTDITLANPLIPEYEKKDPMICASNERIWGELWADGLPVDDYKVSPVNGDMTVLGKVELFAGTREMLYPDAVQLYELMKKAKVDVKFTEGVGLNHVYQVFPIPEARKTLKYICRVIESA